MPRIFSSPPWSGVLRSRASRETQVTTLRNARPPEPRAHTRVEAFLCAICVAGGLLFLALFILLLLAVILDSVELLQSLSFWIPRVGLGLLLCVCVLSIIAQE